MKKNNLKGKFLLSVLLFLYGFVMASPVGPVVPTPTPPPSGNPGGGTPVGPGTPPQPPRPGIPGSGTPVGPGTPENPVDMYEGLLLIVAIMFVVGIYYYNKRKKLA